MSAATATLAPYQACHTAPSVAGSAAPANAAAKAKNESPASTAANPKMQMGCAFFNDVLSTATRNTNNYLVGLGVHLFSAPCRSPL